MSLVLAIDIGTGSCRGALYSNDLKRIESAAVEYPTNYPQPDWGEQDPEVLYQAVLKILREITVASQEKGMKIAALTFDCSVHTLLGLGKDKAPVTPILTWEDSRSRALVEQWKKEQKGLHLYSLTGCPLHPMYSPAKIAWWRNYQPDLFQNIHYFVTAKAFIIYRLTGELLEDQATLSGSGLMNIHQLDWEEEALQLAGIDRGQVAPVVAPSERIKGLRADISEITGLAPTTPVVVGSSDAAMSCLGTGAIHPEQMTVMIGTSGAARRLTDQPVLDPKQRNFCYYSGNNQWFAGGAINNGGIVLRWYRDNFGGRADLEAKERGVSTYSVLSEYAETVGPGAAGLLFLPFLAGERSPYWNGNMRGIYFGVSLHHGQAAFIRALMEGVAYRMHSVCQPLNELIGKPTEILVTGGFSRSGLWLQILADVFGSELHVTGEPEGSSLGAAAFAFHSLGQLDSFDRLTKVNPVKQIIRPDTETSRFYQQEFQRYMRIYHKISAEFLR
jgi:gluconokinase